MYKHFFQIDIEGSELDLIPLWARQGLLKHVSQIGVELHAAVFKVEETFRLVQELYRNGFRLIAWDPNLCVGVLPFQQFHWNVEVVFRKTNGCA